MADFRTPPTRRVAESHQEHRAQLEPHVEGSPAELGIFEKQLAVVALDDVLDHGSADTLARMLGVEPLATTKNAFALILSLIHI